MNQPLTKTQPYPQTTKGRCAFRTNHISWCSKLEKTCDAPNEYNHCPSYQAKHPIQPIKQPAHQTIANEKTAFPRKAILIGTQIGKCDICKDTKKTLLLKYGFTLCEDCIIICTSILEQLELQKTNQPSKNKASDSRQTESPSTKLKEV